MITLVATLAVVVALAFAAPLLLPAPAAKSIAGAMLGKVLGHPVKIAGKAEISLLPTFRLDVEGISAVASDVPEAPLLFDIPRIRVEAEALPILFSRIHIRTIHAEGPVLRLNIDSKGRSNWRRHAEPVRSAVAAGFQPDHDWGLWNELRIDSIKISDGRAYFQNDKSGRRISAQGIILSSSNPINTDGGPGFLMHGDAVVNGEHVGLKFETGPIRKFLSGDRLPVVGELSSEALKFRYQGAAAKRQFFVSEGALTIKADDLAVVEQWLGRLLHAPVSGGLEVTARVDINGPRLSFDDVLVRMDGNETKGAVIVSVDGRGKTHIAATLTADTFDLTPFVPLIQRSDGAVSAPNFLSLMIANEFNGTLGIHWDGLKYAGLKTGAGNAKIVLGGRNRRLDVEISIAKLYQGRGKGRLQFGVSEGMSSLKLGFNARKVDVGEFLADALGEPPSLSGHVDWSVELFSVGGTAAELVAALYGQGQFNLTRGDIHDGKLINHLMDGGSDRFAYDQILGSFSIRQGIISGDDLLLRAPNVSLVGAGQIDLAGNRVNVDLRSLSAPGRNTATLKTVTPFKIEGTLAAMEFRAE